MNHNKKDRVMRYATYKGRRVFLGTQDNQHYYASYYLENEGAERTDWMLEMRNVGKGEYWGKIAIDDPELQIDPLAPTRFWVADLVDLSSLANKLKQRRRPIDKWIAEQLPPSTHSLLDNYQGGASTPTALQNALIEDLNRIILRGESIFDRQRFDSVVRRDVTQTLGSQRPQGTDLQRLNRYLIEDAYPQEISRDYPPEST
jgi:hypothetical protein